MKIKLFELKKMIKKELQNYLKESGQNDGRKEFFGKDSNIFDAKIKEDTINTEGDQIVHKLQRIDNDVWQSNHYTHGGDVEKHWNTYLDSIEFALEKRRIFPSLTKMYSKKIYRDLEAENFHSLNKALKELEYI